MRVNSRNLVQMLTERQVCMCLYGIGGMRMTSDAMRLDVCVQILAPVDGVPTSGAIVCSGVHDFAIRPRHPAIIMGAPPIHLYQGPTHPLLWPLHTEHCDLTAPEPLKERLRVAAALFDAHQRVAEDFLPFRPPVISNAWELAAPGAILSGPRPLIEAYVQSLAEIGIASECIPRMPYLQPIPGSDGDAYDPPRPFKLLLMDQSYVIAEEFLLELSEPQING